MFVTRKKHLRIKRNLEGAVAKLKKELEVERSKVEPLQEAKDKALRDIEILDGKVKRLEKALIDKDILGEKLKKKFSGQYSIIKEIEEPVRTLMGIVNVFREQEDGN